MNRRALSLFLCSCGLLACSSQGNLTLEISTNVSDEGLTCRNRECVDAAVDLESLPDE